MKYTHTHTQVLDLKNIGPIKFDVRSSVLIKTSMLPAGGASLGTKPDMHSWECRSHDNLILCSPFVVVLAYTCLVTDCVCLFHHCTRTIREARSRNMSTEKGCILISHINMIMINDHNIKNKHKKTGNATNFWDYSWSREEHWGSNINTILIALMWCIYQTKRVIKQRGSRWKTEDSAVRLHLLMCVSPWQFRHSKGANETSCTPTTGGMDMDLWS